MAVAQVRGEAAATRGIAHRPDAVCLQLPGWLGGTARMLPALGQERRLQVLRVNPV